MKHHADICRHMLENRNLTKRGMTPMHSGGLIRMKTSKKGFLSSQL